MPMGLGSIGTSNSTQTRWETTYACAKLLDPTLDQLRRRGGVTWSHPAFAYRHVFARNEKESVCADLSADGEVSALR
jgi:hypothetical protein